MTPGDIWERGYTIGKRAQRGDSLPHPANTENPELFWHAMRAGLWPRGLNISMFMMVIAR